MIALAINKKETDYYSNLPLMFHIEFQKEMCPESLGCNFLSIPVMHYSDRLEEIERRKWSCVLY